MRKRWLAKLLMYLMLEVGALSGMPIRSDEIEQLLQATERPQVVKVWRRQTDGDDNPPK